MRKITPRAQLYPDDKQYLRFLDCYSPFGSKDEGFEFEHARPCIGCHIGSMLWISQRDELSPVCRPFFHSVLFLIESLSFFMIG